MRVMECVRVHQVLVKWLMLNINLNHGSLDTFLRSVSLSRGTAASLSTVVLNIILEKDTLFVKQCSIKLGSVVQRQ